MKFRDVQHGVIITTGIALIPTIELLLFKEAKWRKLTTYVRFLNVYLFFEFDFKFEKKKGGENGKIKG